MANTPENPTKYTFLASVNKLDEVHARLSFMQNAISQSSDWIAADAATGMFFTIQTIMDDARAVSLSVHANLKEIKEVTA